MSTERKKEWVLSEGAFDRLLVWLDGSVHSDGQRYLDIRRRLAGYFDRKNCAVPEELADETLNRVARRLEEEGMIQSEAPARYCYIVARFVFMEHLRETKRVERALFEMGRVPNYERVLLAEAVAEKELRHECLDACLNMIEAEKRELITRYYFGNERIKIDNRRSLARNLGITVNALAIRACRVREKIEKCMHECFANR